MSRRALPLLEPVPADDRAVAVSHPRPPQVPPPPAPGLTEFDTLAGLLPRFHIWTLGCQMNRSDSEEMAGTLLAAGCNQVATPEEADLLVINSCAIRESAEQKIIGRMGLLARRKQAEPRLRVVLTGCSVREQDAAALRRRYPAVDLFLRPDQESELAIRLGLGGPISPGALAAGRGGPGGRSSPGLAHTGLARTEAVATGRLARQGGTSAWLPIIYGCDKTCTYCIVPLSRGAERSRPFDDVMAEARSLATAGYREVTLLGQNVNSYGHDLPPDERFADVRSERRLGRRLAWDGRPDIASLLVAIDSIRDEAGRPRIPRLRFVTSHPWDLGPRLIEAMATCPSVCQHLHLPVQSGDDAVLKRMGRQYSVSAYLELVGRLREAVPGMSLTTDVIVGFCGETDTQFEATLDLLRQVRFDGVFAAAFSPRPGTPAARLRDDVPAAEKRRRLNALLDLQEGISSAANASRVGQTLEVLVEEVRARPGHSHAPALRGGPADPSWVRLAGRSRAHTLVHLDGPASLVGEIVPVHIERSGPYALAGRLEDPV